MFIHMYYAHVVGPVPELRGPHGLQHAIAYMCI